MAQEQDSLYETTYIAYCQNDFEAVKRSKIFAENNYPLSPLMPRFLFLNAVAVAKTEGQPAFITELQNMVTRYPESELAAMAKDMLALMGQGAESQKGNLSSLQAHRDRNTSETTAMDSVQIQFSTERNTPSLVLLVIDSNEDKLNQLLYEVAIYNFSQFMIKDFDLKLLPTFGNDQMALQISGFERLDDAEWYMNLFFKNSTINQYLQSNEVDLTNTNFTSVDGVLFSKDKKELYQYPIGKIQQSYTIPDNTITIKEGAFQYSTLQSITITDTINATAIPTRSIISSDIVNAKPNFNIFNKLAPNITGIARKNVNSAATVRDTPIRSAPTIVAPERDVPGINASIWKIPIQISILNVSCEIFVTFGVAFLFLFL